MFLSVKKIIFIGLLLRFFVAFWNGFFGPSPGADFDAQGLNGFASAVAISGKFDEFSIGFTPYTNLLGLFYSLTINHIFIGSILSCFAWWLSADILYKSFLFLSVDRQLIKKALWIFALLPSSVMITAVTLREPYQLLFVNLAIYAALQIYLHRAFKLWFTLIPAIIGAGSMHGGLLAFGILLVAGTLVLVSMRDLKRIKWTKILISFIFSAVILKYGFSFFGNISYNWNDGLASSIESYQEAVLRGDARTNYKSNSAISGSVGLLIFIPVGLFQYFFEPFPWHVSAASDGLLMLENILRAWLILKAWKALRVAPLPQGRALLLIFFSYLAMETIWSLGTVNWGTAVRHHIPSIGLLLIAAFAYPGNKLSNRT